MQACLYKPGFYQSVDFAVLFHPGHCLFFPADWATNRRVSWCVAIISASILNFVRTAIHFSSSSLFVILAACWWVPVICWVLFYKIKPLLLGFLLFSDDLGLHSQLCPYWKPFPSSSLLFVLIPQWVYVISPVLFHKIKPLLRGFLVSRYDCFLRSQICPCCNPLPSSSWFVYLTSQWFPVICWLLNCKI